MIVFVSKRQPFAKIYPEKKKMDYNSATSEDDIRDNDHPSSKFNDNPSPKFNDFSNNKGLMGSWRSRGFNGRFWPGVRRGIQFVVLGALFALTIEGIKHFKFDVWNSAPMVDFIPCSLDLPAFKHVVDMTNNTQKIACSTRFQTIEQPCVCCVFGTCWRDVRIVSNSSFVSIAIDRQEGILYKRILPVWMRVCYWGLDDTDYSTCQREENETVGYVLRAVEKIRGWEPAGDVIH
jgi:hypothetical protein